MEVFVAIADCGSLTAAADVLDLSRAMASRHLEALERWLGVRLFHRTTRRVSLTDAGEEALEHCRQILELALEVRTAAGARHTELAGRLRVTTSGSFAQAWLAGEITAFMALHPRTTVELLAIDRAVNLVEERVDLAVRITNRLDDAMVARRLAVCRSVLCAAPRYLEAHGLPTSAASLEGHRWVAHARLVDAGLRLDHGGATVTVPIRTALTTNDTSVLAQATLEGAGIAMLPTYLASDDLVAGRLVRVLPDHEPEALGIHALYLSRRHQPLLLRTLLDFIAQRLAGDMPPWDRALAAMGGRKKPGATTGRRSR